MDSDQIVRGVEAVHLDQFSRRRGPVDHEQRVVVVGIDLGALAEVFGVSDCQRVKTEGIASRAVALSSSRPARSNQKRAEESMRRLTFSGVTWGSEPSAVIR